MIRLGPKIIDKPFESGYLSYGGLTKRKPVAYICDCGVEFESAGGNVKSCPKCTKERIKNQNKRACKKYKAARQNDIGTVRPNLTEPRIAARTQSDVMQQCGITK